MAVQSGHETVLLHEAVQALIDSAPAGRYVDATFGRGGHTAKLLDALAPDSQLMVIDKDPEAIAVAKKLAQTDKRVVVKHGSFAELDRFLEEAEWSSVDGVLADLGVSSPQLDDAHRGFSFMQEGPLDMRMNPDVGDSAAQWLQKVSEAELVRVLRDYGEEKFAKRIARAVIAARDEAPLDSTLALAKIVAEANPSWEKHKHPATRAFQAIRIAVNNELGDLEVLLESAAARLSVGGKLVIISFHSLEDRIVKRFMRDKAKGDAPPAGVPLPESAIKRPFRVRSKALKPGTEEISRNVRSRSAVMRVMERVSDATI